MIGKDGYDGPELFGTEEFVQEEILGGLGLKTTRAAALITVWSGLKTIWMRGKGQNYIARIT